MPVGAPPRFASGAHAAQVVQHGQDVSPRGRPDWPHPQRRACLASSPDGKPSRACSCFSSLSRAVPGEILVQVGRER